MEKSGGSRLLQMQARFQQRQKEHKLVAMYEAQQARALTRLTASSTTHQLEPDIAAVAVPRQGKVRQMFEERRSRAGIDKSYPLQPIHGNTPRAAPAPPAPPAPAARRPARPDKPASTPAKQTVNGVRKTKAISGGIGAGDVTLAAATPPPPHRNNLTRLGNDRFSERRKPQPRSPLDTVDLPGARTDRIEDETFPDELAPPPSARVVTPAPDREPSPVATRPNNIEKRAAAAQRVAGKSIRGAGDSSSVDKPARTDLKVGRARTEASSEQATPRESMIKNPQPHTSVQKVAAGSAERAGGPGETCGVCGRKFASDRLARHEEICRKTAAKKRKPYDALKHRLEGTEAQPFIKQLRKQTAPGRSAAVSQQPSRASKTTLNSTWRQKHEDFICAIRAAKTAQAHVAAGGKLSDLPPPPPSENPDYVQCPHCQRRFNQTAAERHIPKCATFIFNKTKPPPKKR